MIAFIFTLEKEMAIHSSILAWEIPWTEKPGRPQSMESQRVGHHLATEHARIFTHTQSNAFYKGSGRIYIKLLKGFF